MPVSNKTPSLLVIFLTVFIDLIGFGMVIPLLPFYALAFDASPLAVTLLSGVYSLMQFLFSTFWGALSDRYGRRPILLFSIGGTIASYLLFAAAGNLVWLFISRISAGIFTANFGAAQAYIADITTRENRSRGMGLFGAAFGLGFIFGPAIGGLLSPLGYEVPGLVAAGLSLVNLTFAWFFLPESLSLQIRERNKLEKKPVFNLTRHFSDFFRLRFSNTALFLLILIVYIVITGHSIFESTFALLMENRMNYQAKELGFLFAIIGVITAIVQGGLIGKLSRTFGNRNLIVTGLILTVISQVLLPWVNPDNEWFLFVIMVFYSGGLALFAPSMNGMISNMAGEHEQGRILGLSQGFSSLGRITGPVLGGFAFGSVSPVAPFYICATLLALGLLLLLSKIKTETL